MLRFKLVLALVPSLSMAGVMAWNPDVEGILDDVVHQFSDPFAFFRELVQNSIDAGTNEIEIDVAYHDEDGLAVASVRDFGCGMNREIIETQLCRLFSSDKYQDYTKIGRFGIGFVSVYGVEPDWVCVDTGRDGLLLRERENIPTMTGPMTPRACERAQSLLFADAPSPLAAAVASEQHVVVLGPASELAPVFGRRPRDLHDEFVLLQAVPLRHHHSAIANLVEPLVRQPIWLGSCIGPRRV